MNRYGTQAYLQENQLYTVRVKIKGQEKEFSFTSRYNPLYSTVRLVRSDFRDLFKTYTDDEINRRIYDNSRLAFEIANPPIELDEDGVVPYMVKQYVRYKTELDLATDLFLTLTTQSGQTDKQLADMRIVKQVQLPYLSSILKVLEQRLASWESQLAGMKAAPTGAVRAGVNSFPLNGRNSF